MKTCVRCSSVFDDYASSCTKCGATFSASGPAPVSASPQVAWQPIGGSATTAVGSGPTQSHHRRPVIPNTPPPPTDSPGVGWSPSSLAPQAPPPFQVPVQPPRQRTPAPAAGADLKPLIPRTDVGIISRAEQVRDQIHSWIENYCRSKGIEPSILKSTPYSPFIWVECRAWTPSEPSKTSTDRSVLYIALKTMPFHTFEILYDITLGVGAFDKKHTDVCELNQNVIEEMLDVVLRGDVNQVKHFKLQTVRKHPLQLWRPKNEVTALDKSINVTSVLNFVAVICLIVGGGLLGVAPPLGLFGMAVGVIAWIIMALIQWDRKRRRWQYQNQGKPLQEPRTLHRLDSWQALVFDIGPEVTSIRQEILAELRKGISSGFVVETEVIWYWGLDGKEEREQIVARFRRGIAFIQIYEYGQDLFVGWDANINSGTWVEQEVARGRKGGRMFSLRTVVAGTQRYTEYDLFDTNCLLEWVHGAITKVVKRTMAHHHIDQEIDFKIIRGDRNVSAAPAAPAATAPRKSHNPFRRVE
jgi:hypothetical protein